VQLYIWKTRYEKAECDLKACINLVCQHDDEAVCIADKKAKRYQVEHGNTCKECTARERKVDELSASKLANDLSAARNQVVTSQSELQDAECELAKLRTEDTYNLAHGKVKIDLQHCRR
jgi:hypothetical protein